MVVTKNSHFIFSLSLLPLPAPYPASASQRLTWGGHNLLLVGMQSKCAAHFEEQSSLLGWSQTLARRNGFGAFFDNQLYLSEIFLRQSRSGK